MMVSDRDPETPGTKSRANPEEHAHLRSGRARAATAGVAWSTVSTLAPTLVSTLVFVVATRFLDPGDFGIVTFAAVLVSMVGGLTPAGFSDALVQRSHLDAEHLDATFWLCLGSSVLVYAVVVLLAVPAGRMFGDQTLAPVLWVIGTKLITDLLAVVPNALLTRTMRFRPLAVRSLVASTLAGGVCLGMLHLGFGLWALVGSQVIGSFVACVASWASVDWRPRRQFSTAAVRDLARFGLFATAGRVVTGFSIDQLMVGSLLGPTAVGLFGFARRIFVMLTDVVSTPLNSVSYSLLSAMQSEPEKLREAILISTFASSLVAFPLFLGLAVVSPDAVPLIFGPQWREAVPLLQIFCAAGLLASIGVIQLSVIRSLGRADWWMWYQVAQQLMTVVVVLVFFTQGVAIVATAIVLKTWLIWPVSLLMTTHLAGLSVQRYLAQFLLPLAACLFMVATLLLLRALFRAENDAIQLATEIAIGAGAYSVFLWLIARKRLMQLLGLLPRPWKKGVEHRNSSD